MMSIFMNIVSLMTLVSGFSAGFMGKPDWAAMFFALSILAKMDNK